MQRTIPALWQKALAANRTAPAYLAEEEDGWREVSWEEASRRVEDVAFGLLALGIEKGDVIGIMAATRLEWALVDFALARIGAVTAPIYPTSSAGDCAYMLGLVEANGVFVDEERRSLASPPSRTSSHWRHWRSSRSADAPTASSTRTRSPRRRARSARTTSTPSSIRRGRPARPRPA